MTVIYYETVKKQAPIEKFLEGLASNREAQSKCLSRLKALEEDTRDLGKLVQERVLKKVSGFPDLFQRAVPGKDQIRIMVGAFCGELIVLDAHLRRDVNQSVYQDAYDKLNDYKRRNPCNIKN